MELAHGRKSKTLPRTMASPWWPAPTPTTIFSWGRCGTSSPGPLRRLRGSSGPSQRGEYAIGIDADLKLDIARARATKLAIKADRLGV